VLPGLHGNWGRAGWLVAAIILVVIEFCGSLLATEFATAVGWACVLCVASQCWPACEPACVQCTLLLCASCEPSEPSEQLASSQRERAEPGGSRRRRQRRRRASE